MRYRLYREQYLECDLETAWMFFSSALNLQEITPDTMKFEVLTPLKSDDKIYEGMEIDYRVSPFLGIALDWKTRITEVKELKSFTDFQEKGPYKYWSHHHVFEQRENGVLMKDTVDYELPFGVLGRLVHALWVRPKLEYIFDFRKNYLKSKF